LAPRSLVLDTGAVIALSRGDRATRALVTAALQDDVTIIVPPIVVSQTLRGGPRDASVHRLLHVIWVPFVGRKLAAAAGVLLGRSGLVDAADAQVMAEAIRSGPSIVLTGDLDDMTRLANGRGMVRVVRI
jgi:predicted nucleic acid-binding protein